MKGTSNTTEGGRKGLRGNIKYGRQGEERRSQGDGKKESVGKEMEVPPSLNNIS